MTDTVQGPAPRPCESCPYRRDVPSGAVSRPRWPTLAERRAHRELEP